MKMSLKIVLASLMFAVGCATAPRDVIKVASYNIRLSGGGGADRGTPNAWKERKEDLLALVQKLDLDVFGLQEVCPDQAQFLRENLADYEFVGEHRNADRTSGEASPVCYRKSRFEALDKGTFWLSETPDTPGLKGWGAACPRVCSYLILRDRSTGKKFCFANVHTDHISALARKNGMLLVIERMKKFGSGLPIVFTGDHNCRETEEPAKAVKEQLKDALYVSENPQKGSWRTFSGWKWVDQEVSIKEALQAPSEMRNAKKGSPDSMKDANGLHPYEKYGARIDYIFTDAKCTSAHVVPDENPEGLFYSDHHAVCAEIELD